MELLNHSSLKSEKLQCVGWVMGLGLGQTPVGIGDDGICPIIMGLVEGSPLAGPTSIGVQLERLGKVGIGQIGCCGVQMLQLIK